MLFRSWPEIACCFFVKISGSTIMKTNSHSWIGRIFELLPISIASCCWGTQVEGSHKGKLPLLGDSWKSEDVKVSICKGEIWISNFPMIIEKSGAPKVKKKLVFNSSVLPCDFCIHIAESWVPVFFVLRGPREREMYQYSVLRADWPACGKWRLLLGHFWCDFVGFFLAEISYVP